MSLNYKGFSAHNTWLGILFSLVHIMIISCYGTAKFYQMFMREDPETAMNVLYHDLDDELTLNAKELKFDLAFSLWTYTFSDGKSVLENLVDKVDPSILKF